MTLMTEVHEQLQALNMNNAAQVLPDLIDRAQQEDWSPLATIKALLGSERDERAVKARNRRLKEAAFPYMATIEEFDFGFQTSVSKDSVPQTV